ncbi:MAG TPA: hypothetical protein VEF04_16525 [Blastocatellia bacterium]|nr:hypothetical protein [Blastocatellia bacterium]
MPSKKAASSTLTVISGEAAQICRPFTVEFRLTAPEAGYKIMVMVEKSCSQNAEPIWKLVFDLFRKIDNEFVEIVHVSFKAEAPVEKQGVEKIAADGVHPKSARVLKQEVFPVAKQLENRPPTAEEKAALKSGMSKAAATAVEI